MPRDAEATRQRLIAAATAEFAAFGIAGARVDRIATHARANKAQIYHYFGSKAALFDAVWEAAVTQIITEAPLDVSDLPGWAADLSEVYARHPDIARLISWQRLERASHTPLRLGSATVESYLKAITAAQAEGKVSDRFDAGVLYLLIVDLAMLWRAPSPEILAAIKVPCAAERREIIIQAVAGLLR